MGDKIGGRREKGKRFFLRERKREKDIEGAGEEEEV